TGHKRQIENAKNQAAAEFGALPVLVIEVDLVRVVCEQREPDVVVFRHRPPEAAAINVSYFEIFKEASFPAGLDRHRDFSYVDC
ncbi:MAG: hypothetical protein ACRD3S_00630, partial [Terracidiphilus sp.]